MFEDGLAKMWVSFVSMGLMFLSVVLTIFAKEKLSGLLRYSVLSVTFVMIMVSGVIIFLVVATGPVPE
ncbi:DUF2768 domain-containing protein [Salisediminibacterium selenitireducens]|uniref:DUF2768 domain-containing protein n=1 Tax=Bacillus selenitireducens (strain ATCC 700615 / DSM 15326 / MLS10) TaxID=439292 RepID=D6XVA7_BACIE|nr:DUF2768 domain-containing protein [Salisediminibacterium selenitireducens]ADH99645.1 hypothetical protein Bsel_2141 [[Bacillus] selenitireducens MLS10]